MESRKFLSEAIAAAFIHSFTDVLFEMITVDGELRLFNLLTFNIQDKIAYVKTSDDTLEIVRHASHTVDLDVTATRTLFSEAVRSYDFVVAEATALALKSVNSITGKEEKIGFDELSREAVLDSMPLPADIEKRAILEEKRIRNASGGQSAAMRHPVGYAFKPGGSGTTTALDPQTIYRDPIYTSGAVAVHKRFHELQAKLQLTREEVLSFMQCATEGIIGLLSKYSECDLGVMGKLYAYRKEAVEIRIRSCTLPIALPRGLTVKWVPSHRLVDDSQYKSKYEIRRKHYINLSDEEKIWITLKQLLAKASVLDEVIMPDPTEPDATPDLITI
jgi:hypothetical protein